MLSDPKRYWHHVEHFDLSDAEKTELINMVHLAMQSGVDRAFGDDPARLALAENGADVAPPPYDVIDLSSADYAETAVSQTFNDKKGAKTSD